MWLVARFPCVRCRKKLVEDFLLKDDGEYIFCMFCEVFSKVNEEIDKLSAVLEKVVCQDTSAQEACLLKHRKSSLIQINVWIIEAEGNFGASKVYCNCSCGRKTKAMIIRSTIDLRKCKLDVPLSEIQTGETMTI